MPISQNIWILETSVFKSFGQFGVPPKHIFFKFVAVIIINDIPMVWIKSIVAIAFDHSLEFQEFSILYFIVTGSYVALSESVEV